MAQELVTLVTVAQEGPGWSVRAADGAGQLFSTHATEAAATESADLIAARLAAERGLALEAVRFSHADVLQVLQPQEMQALVALPWDTFLANLQATGSPGDEPGMDDTQPLEEGWGPEHAHASSQPQESAAAPAPAAPAPAPASAAPEAADVATVAVDAEGDAAAAVPAGSTGRASGGGAAARTNPWRLLEGGGACKVMTKSEVLQLGLTEAAWRAAFEASQPPARVLLHHPASDRTYALDMAPDRGSRLRLGKGWAALQKGLALQAGDTVVLRPAAAEDAAAIRQQHQQEPGELGEEQHDQPAAHDPAPVALVTVQTAAETAAGATVGPLAPLVSPKVGGKRLASGGLNSTDPKQQRLDTMWAASPRHGAQPPPPPQQQQVEPAQAASLAQPGHNAAASTSQQPGAVQPAMQPQGSAALPALSAQAAGRQLPLLQAGGGVGVTAAAVGSPTDPFQLYLAAKPLLATCGLPAEQRTLFWQAWMQLPEWRQRMQVDLLHELAREEAWAQLERFVQREATAAAAAAPAAAGYGAPAASRGGSGGGSRD